MTTKSFTQRFINVITIRHVLALIATFAVVLLATEIFTGVELSLVDEEDASLLPGFLIGLGIFIALLTFERDSEDQNAERQRRNDEIAFEAARDAMRKAAELLSDRNNDRETWVNAARLLLNAQRLAQSIQTDPIQEAMQLELANTRYSLRNLLLRTHPKSGKRTCLPPAFFTGLSEWEEVEEGEEALKDAFIKTAATTETGWVGLNIMLSEPALKNLAKESVVAIYDFIATATWGDEDPLKNVIVWDTKPADAHPGIDQGAKHYIYASRRYSVFGDKLHERDPKE